MTQKLKDNFPLLLTFLLLSILIKTSEAFLKSNNIDTSILLNANWFLFLIGILTLGIQSKAIHHNNLNVFIRSVMGGMMIKMFLSAIAVFVYVYTSAEEFNKRGIFIAMFFYLIYLAVEVFSLMKMNKAKNG